MVDSVTFPAAATFATAAATPAGTAPAPTVVEFASPPPPSLLAAGGVIAATVVGSDGEVLTLRTDFGAIALKTLLALDPGTSVELKLFAGGAAILSADGAPLGYGALRAATAPAGAPATVAMPQTETAPAVVELGQAVRATVVAPASTPGAPAAGTELALRVASGASPSPPSTLTATVVQGGGARTLVDSALGRLALDARIDLPAGSPLTLQRLAAPVRTRTIAPPSSPALGSGWPALDDALATLDRVAPNIAAQWRADLSPTAAPRLAAALLFFMGVLKGDASWPGDPVSLALTAAGRADLRARLAKEVSDLRQQASESARGDWRIFTLPVLDEAAVQPIRLYVRNPRDGGSGGDGPQGSRFVLDLDLTRLGPLQLDGLVRGAKFDLVLRSHEPLDPVMKAEIGALFHSALEGTGLSGDVAFVNTAQFPVSPLSALRPRLGLKI